MSLITYLFPKRRLKHQLPLLPRGYSSREGRVDPKLLGTISLLKGHNVAKTDQDAMRLIARYRGKTAQYIIKAEHRERWHYPTLTRAWRRFKKLW